MTDLEKRVRDKEAKDAAEVAEIFADTNIDRRGYLMMAIAAQLQGKGQHFTSSLFDSMADKYNAA